MRLFLSSFRASVHICKLRALAERRGTTPRPAAALQAIHSAELGIKKPGNDFTRNPPSGIVMSLTTLPTGAGARQLIVSRETILRASSSGLSPRPKRCGNTAFSRTPQTRHRHMAATCSAVRAASHTQLDNRCGTTTPPSARLEGHTTYDALRQRLDGTLHRGRKKY